MMGRNIKAVVISVGMAAGILFTGGCSGPHGSPETTVTIGTFNIEWLGDGTDDRHARNDADYLRIADIIIKSKADVLGVQEIENDRALQRVLRYMDGYKGFLAATSGPQNVGVIYKAGVEIDSIDTYRPLQLDAPDDLRPGLVVRGRKGAFEWVQLIVHLKSTSRYDSTIALQDLSRDWRSRQCAVIRKWADSVMMADPHVHVVITGDLNDYPQRARNGTLTALAESEKLMFLTQDLASCKDKKWHVIDHVVVSRTAEERYIGGSARTENLYDFLSEEEAEGVSDHCPVVVRFGIN